MRSDSNSRNWMAGIFTLVGWIALFAASVARAQSTDAANELNESEKARLLVFRSDHFTLYTDLVPRDAVPVLDQLEAVVQNLGSYWGRPLKGKIKCFLVSDLTIWPAELLNDANGRAKIAEKSGINIPERIPIRTGESIQSTIYAFADGSTPQRQVVPAFCWQTFGRCGPDWFMDGLGEVAANWRTEGELRCPAWMAEYLHANMQGVSATVVGDQFAGRRSPELSAHRWALCYLLATDARYCQRFRQFGYDNLSGRSTQFAERFPELGPQLDADCRNFVTRLAVDRGVDKHFVTVQTPATYRVTSVTSLPVAPVTQLPSAIGDR